MDPLLQPSVAAVVILAVMMIMVGVMIAPEGRKRGVKEEEKRREAAQKLGIDPSFLQKPKPTSEADAALIGYMNQHLAMLNSVASKLPPIPSGENAFAGMSRKEREKLG